MLVYETVVSAGLRSIKSWKGGYIRVQEAKMHWQDECLCGGRTGRGHRKACVWGKDAAGEEERKELKLKTTQPKSALG